MTLPYYFHLGVDAEDYQTPAFTVTYTNFDTIEGLPDDELCEPECRGYTPLPEECPEECGGVVIDEADFGDE